MPPGRLPTFLIIGVPKAGTAALSFALGEQPEVFSHPAKELHFFDEHFERGLDWYRSQFANAGDASAVGEATPTYVLRDQWVERAASAIPDARIILQVRHPVDRFWSSYWFFRLFGFESRSIPEIFREDTGVGSGSPTDRMGHIRAGWYDEIYDRITRAWPEENLFVIDAADLRRHPAETVTKAARHVGVVDPTETEPGTSHNRMTLPRSEVVHRIFVTALRRGWITSQGRLARTWLKHNWSAERPPPLEPSLRQMLLDHYEPHVARFEAMVGREFPSWRS